MNNKYAPQVDWITLCSYKFKSYTDIAAWLRTTYYSAKWKAGRWLQYDGFNGPAIFYGKALQSHDREHYIVKVSGIMADDFYRKFRVEGFADTFYCTRLDLQVTAPKPVWWIPRDVLDDSVNYGPKGTLIESESGSTVYLGSRASGRFTRLYEKKIGDKTHLRLEIELKGGHARDGYEYLLDGATAASLYASHLLKLPMREEWIQDYLPENTDRLDLTLAVRKSDSEARLKWLKTLISTFDKMLNDHTVHEQTFDIFETLIEDYKARIRENDNSDTSTNE